MSRKLPVQSGVAGKRCRVCDVQTTVSECRLELLTWRREASVGRRIVEAALRRPNNSNNSSDCLLQQPTSPRGCTANVRWGGVADATAAVVGGDGAVVAVRTRVESPGNSMQLVSKPADWRPGCTTPIRYAAVTASIVSLARTKRT